MIVKMRKAAILIPEKDVSRGLETLRRLGMVHVEAQPETRSDSSLREIEQEMTGIQEALKILPVSSNDELPERVSQKEVKEIRRRVADLAEERERLREEIAELSEEVDSWEPWGDFDPEEVRYLREKGLSCRLLVIRGRDFKGGAIDLPHLYVLNKRRGHYYSVYLGGKDLPASPGIREIRLPKWSPGKMKQRLHRDRNRLKTLEDELGDLAERSARLKAGLEAWKGEYRYRELLEGTEQEEGIACLQGYICLRDTGTLKKAAARNHWGLLIRIPGPEDPVPTLVENPRWLRMIRPVFKLLGTLPGYREFDISPLFLLFLLLFFAMIVGDAGYGLVFAALGWVLVRNSGEQGEKRDAGRLLVTMGLATVAWGTVTGTWFGCREIGGFPVLGWFRIEALSSFNPAGSEIIKKMTFIIGTIHLSLARIQRFIREFPDRRCVAQLGWWGVVVGLYFLVLNIVLNPQQYPLLPVHLALIGSGMLLVVLFEKQRPERGFGGGVFRGLLSLPLTFLDGVSAFSDIISYIRLFAVGLATVEIARSFNRMASDTAEGLAGLILAVLILLVGHSLNIAMSGLSVIVHGVRLKMLEFSSHLGMEWKGWEYRPFREAKITFKENE